MADTKTNLGARLQALATAMQTAGGADESTVKMIFDLKAAASHMDDLDALLALVLDDMQTATNRDLAADGGVGDEEGVIWGKIEKLAGEIRERKTKGSDPEPKMA